MQAPYEVRVFRTEIDASAEGAKESFAEFGFDGLEVAGGEVGVHFFVHVLRDAGDFE